jgi:xanthine/uracil permease
MGLQFSGARYLLTAPLLSSLATLTQTLDVWQVGARPPVVQGTSFAAVAALMLAIGEDAGKREPGLRAIFACAA